MQGWAFGIFSAWAFLWIAWAVYRGVTVNTHRYQR